MMGRVLPACRGRGIESRTRNTWREYLGGSGSRESDVDWEGYFAGEDRRRVPLAPDPTGEETRPRRATLTVSQLACRRTATALKPHREREATRSPSREMAAVAEEVRPSQETVSSFDAHVIRDAIEMR